jgi:hypothetical protein
MAKPLATTTMPVAVTITETARRTDGGSRRKRVILRSIRFGRGTPRRYESGRMG